jgi:D-alanyl-D-alanine carboxypeptidase/D-alanyl-D-alanine-endopeptidase (penicillin-binding protein 4)
MWAQLGGQLQGKVRYGQVPVGAVAAFEHASPPLADVVRDINKFSNNVMAQQLFLRLGSGSFEASRHTVAQWWAKRWPAMPAPLLENGSGLSRTERVSANALGALLQTAHSSDVGLALRESLPIAGLDGTLRQSKVRRAVGQAWLKTGSLRDVMAIAGYVRGESGKFHVLVAIVNHPSQAPVARPVLDALIDWTFKDVSPNTTVISATLTPTTLTASHD